MHWVAVLATDPQHRTYVIRPASTCHQGVGHLLHLLVVDTNVVRHPRHWSRRRLYAVRLPSALFTVECLGDCGCNAK
jgi:hypothetical protein